MAGPGSDADAVLVLEKDGIDQILANLLKKGYALHGPHLRDDAVGYEPIETTADFPAGWGSVQEPGRYRLVRRDDDFLFGYGLAAQGWKRQLYPPVQTLFSAARTAEGFSIAPPPTEAAPMAFIGVRACEIAAMAVQAKVFGDRDFADPGYQRRLKDAFIVAVQCGEAMQTCFCTSMGSGPEVKSGFDVKLVELSVKGRHVFLASSGTARGRKVLEKIKGGKAGPAEMKAQAEALKKAAEQGRFLDRAAAAELQNHAEHPRWDAVGERCLACGNCTMACPTCFCTTVEDFTDLKGDNAERKRKWDSCFTVDFSYIHGGAVRTETGSRYRQWITHKLSTWIDQFDQAGCVGCGRCITWCPVGIDITEEAAAITDGGSGRT